MKKTLFGLIVCLTLLLGPASARASQLECTAPLADKEKASILKKVEKAYQTVNSIRAGFVQRSYFAGLDSYQDAKGEVFFRKPGKMDWRYAEPDKQRFVSDGDSVWFYQPSENQVTIGDFRNAFTTDLPVSFMVGIAKLSERFDLKSACGSKNGILLELLPKTKEPSLDRFSLVVSATDYSARGARVTDIGGNETTILLQTPVFNADIAAEHFSFSIPRGVDIIDRRVRVELVPEGTVKESELSVPETKKEAEAKE